MKEEHKKLIEEIIRKFQEKENGMFHVNDFANLFVDANHRIIVARLIIDDLQLIDRIGTHAFRLNQKGWEFTSFKDLEKLEESKLEKERIELENLIINTKLNKWFFKTKWLPLLLSFAAIAVSIYLNNENIEKQKELELKIIDTQKTNDTLRREIMQLNKRFKLIKHKETPANSG